MHERSVIIDGSPVRLFVKPMTIAQLNAAASLVWSRGASPAPSPADLTERQIDLLNTFVEPQPGEFNVDGEHVSEIASAYASRPEVLAVLYDAMVGAQHVDEQDRENLGTAVRFSRWLSEQREKGSQSKWAQTGTSCHKCHQLNLCAKRGCNGIEQKRAVWHYGTVVTYVCPVLSFTRRVEEALRLFYVTHTFMPTGMGGGSWTLAQPLSAGGALEQDAWMSSAFSVLRNTHMELLNG